MFNDDYYFSLVTAITKLCDALETIEEHLMVTGLLAGRTAMIANNRAHDIARDIKKQRALLMKRKPGKDESVS